MKNIIGTLGVIAVSLVFAPAAFAASDYFLKIDGIDGESKDAAHKGQIEVMSWSWGASNSGSLSGGAAGGASSGRAKQKPLMITKTVDKATPLLFKACASGQHIKNATLSVRNSATKEDGSPLTSEPYLVYTFEDVFCTEFTNSADPLLEEVSLQYGKVKMEYRQADERGKLMSAIKSGWDFVRNILFN